MFSTFKALHIDVKIFKFQRADFQKNKKEGYLKLAAFGKMYGYFSHFYLNYATVTVYFFFNKICQVPESDTKLLKLT